MNESKVRRPVARWVGLAFAVVVVGLLFSLASCTKDPVKKAFSGKFLASENNRVISNYCQTCHTHQNFAAENHMATIKPRYTVRRFREAGECRQCHSVSFSFFRPAHRRTRHPPDGRRF